MSIIIRLRDQIWIMIILQRIQTLKKFMNLIRAPKVCEIC